MFPNLFPRNLIGLARQTNPHHRFQPVMLPLMTIGQYQHIMASVPTERHILGQAEIAKGASFTSPKRQQEWLTGRICAKMAAISYLNSISASSGTPLILPHDFQIESSEQGRPFLHGNIPQQLKSTDISLSHGAGHAVALISDCPCGVDIEEPRPSLLTVREKFCTVAEEELLEARFAEIAEQQRLALLWTAKEAAKKALSKIRMPGFLELLFNEAEAHATGWTIRLLISSRKFNGYPPTITVACELYADYALALCLQKQEENHA